VNIMPSLRETQLAFASSVLGSGPHTMHGLVLECGFSTDERLRIYRNNARIGFHQALRATFPVVEQLGGADWFESAAQRYQQLHPSRHGDLQYVGQSFACFLQGDLAGTCHEWFADVARLEWAYQEVLVAPAGAALDPLTLAPLTGEQQGRVVFAARPDVRLVSASVDVLAIWRAHQPAAAADARLVHGEHHVLLARRADHVELRELPVAEAFLLDCLRSSLGLLPAQQRFAAQHSDADFGGALRRLVQLSALGPFHLAIH
jgi:hypothetical protein